MRLTQSRTDVPEPRRARLRSQPCAAARVLATFRGLDSDESLGELLHDALREPAPRKTRKSLLRATVPVDDGVRACRLVGERCDRGSRRRAVDTALLEIVRDCSVAVALLCELPRPTGREASVVDRAEAREAFERLDARLRRDASSFEPSGDLRPRRIPVRERSHRDIDRDRGAESATELPQALAVEVGPDPEAGARDRVRRHDAPRMAVELERNAVARQLPDGGQARHRRPRLGDALRHLAVRRLGVLLRLLGGLERLLDRHGERAVEPRGDDLLRPDLLLDTGEHLLAHVRMLAEEGRGIVAPLPEPLVAEGEVRTRLLHDLPLDSGVEDGALPGDPGAVDDVELRLLERRRDLVLHDLDANAVAEGLHAVLERFDPPDVEAHRRVELQR